MRREQVPYTWTDGAAREQKCIPGLTSPELVFCERREAQSVARRGPTDCSSAIETVDFRGGLPEAHAPTQVVFRQVTGVATQPAILENPFAVTKAGSRGSVARAIKGKARA